MKKISLTIIFVLGLALMPVFADAQQSAQQQKSYSIMSFDIGYSPFYDFDEKDYFIASIFGFNVRMSEVFTIGVKYLDATKVKCALMSMKYDIMPQARVALGFGSVGDGGANPNEMATSIGFEFVPFKRTYNDALSSEFKVAIDYMMAPKIGAEKGILLFGLILGIGL